MDGFSVHKNEVVMSRLEECNTSVVIIPPNISYLKQPLDGGPNRSLKAFMRRTIVQFVWDNPDHPALSDVDICRMIVAGVEKCWTPDLVTKSFRRLYMDDDGETDLSYARDVDEIADIPSLMCTTIEKEEGLWKHKSSDSNEDFTSESETDSELDEEEFEIRENSRLVTQFIDNNAN